MSTKVDQAPVLFLKELERVLQSRKDEMPKGSYSTRLFKKGIDKIAQKLGEEAVETVIAAKNKKKEPTLSPARLVGRKRDFY
jgi:phosphoribosyl-ATP pyrophosphohydrolase/phosphoribosyl-AMP cyclohydrolase